MSNLKEYLNSTGPEIIEPIFSVQVVYFTPTVVEAKQEITNMEFADIRFLVVALLAIAFGVYLKTTTHAKFQSSKRLWKFLVLAGVATFVLKALAVSIR